MLAVPCAWMMKLIWRLPHKDRKKHIQVTDNIEYPEARVEAEPMGTLSLNECVQVRGWDPGVRGSFIN